MKRPKTLTQPPIAAVNPTQATAAQEKNPRRETSPPDFDLAAGLFAAGFFGASFTDDAGFATGAAEDALPPVDAEVSFGVSSAMALSRRTVLIGRLELLPSR